MAKWSVKTIPELREKLLILAESNQTLHDIYDKDRGLYDDCIRLFGQLRRSFDPKNPTEMAEILRQEILAHPDYEKTKLEELWSEKVELETKLSQAEIETLIEEHEKAGDKRKLEIEQRLEKAVGKKDVQIFIEKQREIARERAKAKTKEPEEVKVVKKEEGVEEKIERKVAEVLPEDTSPEKVTEVTEKIKKVVLEEIPKGEGKINGRKIRDEIRTVVGKNPEAVERLAVRVEEIIAGEKVDSFTDDLGEKLARQMPDNPQTQERIREVIGSRAKRVIYAEDTNIFQAREVGGEAKTLVEEIEAGEISGTVLKQADLEVENFLEERVEVVDKARAGVMKERFEAEMVENLGGEGVISPEQKQAMEDFELMVDKIFYHRAEKPSLDIESYRQAAEATAVDRGVEASRAENSWHELRGVMGVLRTKPREFNRMVELYERGNKLLGDKLPNIPEIKFTERIMKLAAGNKTVLGMINLGQRFVAITDTFNGLGGKFLIKIGADKVGWSLLEKVGGQAGVEFAKEALTIIGKEGLQKGVMAILKGVLGGGVKAGTMAVEGGAAAGAGGGVTALVAAFQAIPVVGQVILVAALAVAAVVVLWKAVVVPVLNVIKSLAQKLNIDLNGVKGGISRVLGGGKFGNFMGSIGQFFFDVGLFFVGIPAFLATLNFTSIVAPVFLFYMVGILGYSLLQSNMVSSLVPPPPGGNCVLKSETESGGLINCDQTAPENGFPGINKESFVSLANRWRTGKNYSEECYNDTVNRALCAGINPAYALWVWVHESGASNYSIANVEDFGIHGQAAAPPKDFNAQINYFLKLDPGSACVNDPRIGGNYWLGFATNYLNGSCDPDEKNVTNGQTGREYLAEMQTSWGWVSSLPMPADIHAAKGGKDCGNIGNNSDSEINNEYTDENGDVWVCYGEVNQPGFEPWDPSIPVPEGCPSGRPTSGGFTQGPFAQGCTHQNMQSPAVDIGTGNGTPIYATHAGVAEIGYSDMPGFYVILHGICEGKSFTTHYYHMPEGGQRVSSNQQVKAGDLIGIVNNMGNSTGPHLHYQINGLDVNKFGQYLGLSVAETQQLWGCCGSWNGKYCP
ncbi:hypothetical protein COS78_04135 [Candidatus Shapirobacteria bacterium CG06_land_8_20_14_3_00_40_12]|uniref:M23ase beta-sheet core domain-containing protein n=1 Tax=Candidatus Shapirobacteria bacterium CG06_land_8_20_14_3_00_40_12 TaxID=1974881 RepID=A0A2M7AR62_9BACT|nr:MAG: hypothetical protein COS78_04135 [Candidatus Shapirobacteria bacterium CG06_land_8_20_14_3_00_40_12]